MESTSFRTYPHITAVGIYSRAAVPVDIRYLAVLTEYFPCGHRALTAAAAHLVREQIGSGVRKLGGEQQGAACARRAGLHNLKAVVRTVGGALGDNGEILGSHCAARVILKVGQSTGEIAVPHEIIAQYPPPGRLAVVIVTELVCP